MFSQVLSKNAKIIIVTLSVFFYLLPFSGRFIIWQQPIVGTDVINDFTKVFIFAVDIVALIGVLILLQAAPKQALPKKTVFLFLCIFIGWAGVSFLMADVHSFLGLILLARLLLAGLLFWTITKIPPALAFTTMAFGLVVSGVIQTFFAVSQFLARGSAGFPILGESSLIIGQEGVASFVAGGEKWLRAYGTLPHPNILALFLTISFLSALALIISLKPHKYKKALIAAAVFIALGLMLTLSRIFIMLAVLGVILFWLIRRPPAGRFAKFKRYGIAAGIVFVFFAGLLVVRSPENDNSLNYRVLYGNAASRLAQSNKVFGIGLGQSVLLGGEALQAEVTAQNTEYQPWMHQPAHSIFMLTFVETGAVGMTLFIIFLVLVTNRVYKKIKKDPLARENIFFVFSGVASVLIVIAMFFEHMFFTSPTALYLSFAVFGLLVSSKNNLDNPGRGL